jgi:hypothetical protein
VLLCGVVIDEPGAGQTGGIAAAPCFRKIVGQIVSNPHLEYAEKMLDIRDTLHARDSAKVCRIPLVCGLTTAKAVELLVSKKIPYEIQGKGSHVVYQSMQAGSILSDARNLVLHAGHAASESAPPDLAGGTRVPDCLGRDMRDAVQMIMQNGLTPYAVGAGTVRMQNPGVGAMVHTTEICTLICSFDG